jgi:hypothetical protein
MHSLLLQLPASEWIASNGLAFAVRAPRPVCSGHTLVALRRCVSSYAEASDAERASLWALVEQVQALDPLRAGSHEVGFAKVPLRRNRGWLVSEPIGVPAEALLCPLCR